MAELLPMLALSPTMEEGVIVRWNKRPGDDVNSGEVLCEVETDKAVMEYEAAVEGKLLKVLVAEGEACTVGDAIAIVGRPGEDTSELEAQARAARKPAAPRKQTPPVAESPLPAAKGPAEAARTVRPPSAQDIERARQAAQRRQAAPAKAPGAAAAAAKASPLARKLASQAGLDVAPCAAADPAGGWSRPTWSWPCRPAWKSRRLWPRRPRR